jgi:hypothetical protein
MTSPLAPLSYAANASAAAVTMLSTSSNFQAWSGAGSQSAALAFIIEDDSGEGALKYASNNEVIVVASQNWGTVRIGQCRRIQRAVQSWGWLFDIKIQLVEHITLSDKASEVFRRARNNAGLIQQDFQSLCGTASNYIVYAEANLGESVIQDPAGALAGCVLTTIDLNCRDIP